MGSSLNFSIKINPAPSWGSLDLVTCAQWIPCNQYKDGTVRWAINHNILPTWEGNITDWRKPYRLSKLCKQLPISPHAFPAHPAQTIPPVCGQVRDWVPARRTDGRANGWSGLESVQSSLLPSSPRQSRWCRGFRKPPPWCGHFASLPGLLRVLGRRPLVEEGSEGSSDWRKKEYRALSRSAAGLCWVGCEACGGLRCGLAVPGKPTPGRPRPLCLCPHGEVVPRTGGGTVASHPLWLDTNTDLPVFKWECFCWTKMKGNYRERTWTLRETSQRWPGEVGTETAFNCPRNYTFFFP